LIIIEKGLGVFGMNKKDKIKSHSYDSWSIYLRLLRQAAPYWLSFVLGILGTVLATSTDGFLTYAVKPLLSNWGASDNQIWFAWLPLIIIVVFSVRGFSYFLSNYYLTRVGRNLVKDFRKHVFAHLMFMPASYYDKETSGKLLSTLIYNTEQVATAATEALITVLQEGMTLIVLIVVMFGQSWQLTLMFLFTAPAIAYITRYTAKRLRHLSTSVQGTMSDLTQIAAEGIDNYKVVRVFGGEEYEKNKFFTAVQQNRQREMKVVVTNTLGSSLTQVITAFPIAVVIFFATRSSIYATLDAASLVAFVFAIVRLLTPLRRLTKVNTEIQKGVAGAHSIFSLLDEQLERDLGTKLITHARGKIEYRDVSFSYPSSKKTILHNISFTVKPGQTVALVGSSGGGKTTLVGLLPRFYDVDSGAILIDDIDIQDYKLVDLRKQFAIVSQHLTLFNDTIARNIAYGTFHNVTEEKIVRAAEAAHIMDFIKHLPEGLDTMVGENGLLLSGGQRQRIAIARALLKDAPILILDEATSALDTESERHIQAALEALMKKRTTLVIAHRLSTIENADKIIVIDHGKIIETGNHEELLALKGQYAKLYTMQFKHKDTTITAAR
jgi:ATP-binding cassette, subfamily B, bacterial MsbA